MKTIGLLGGMSWESSIIYEQIINQKVRARLGGAHSASLLIRSYDFAVIERLQATGDWAQAGRLLAADAARLQAAGAQILVLATNTMHQVYDQIVAAVSIPIPTGSWRRPSGAGIDDASTSVVEPPEGPVQADGAEVVGGTLRVLALVGAVEAAAVPAGRQAPQRGQIHDVARCLAGAGEPGLHTVFGAEESLV
jgi:Asp/Glu/Hydantoin racemase